MGCLREGPQLRSESQLIVKGRRIHVRGVDWVLAMVSVARSIHVVLPPLPAVDLGRIRSAKAHSSYLCRAFEPHEHVAVPVKNYIWPVGCGNAHDIFLVVCFQRAALRDLKVMAYVQEAGWEVVVCDHVVPCFAAWGADWPSPWPQMRSERGVGGLVGIVIPPWVRHMVYLTGMDIKDWRQVIGWAAWDLGVSLSRCICLTADSLGTLHLKCPLTMGRFDFIAEVLVKIVVPVGGIKVTPVRRN